MFILLAINAETLSILTYAVAIAVDLSVHSPSRMSHQTAMLPRCQSNFVTAWTDTKLIRSGKVYTLHFHAVSRSLYMQLHLQARGFMSRKAMLPEFQ